MNESTENQPENHRYAERDMHVSSGVCVSVCGFVWVRVYECVRVFVCVGIGISRRSFVLACFTYLLRCLFIRLCVCACVRECVFVVYVLAMVHI